MTAKLDRQAWIAAGLDALAGGGVDQVRVERLAAALKVTKGSFYWHFRDRDDLLAAMLDAWQAEATGDIIARVEAKGGDATSRLTSLFSFVVRSDGRLDMAVRDWAGRDEVARLAQQAVDARRLGYVEALFRDLGFSDAQAGARARFAYQALIGQFRMGGQPVEQRAADMVGIILPMMTRPGPG